MSKRGGTDSSLFEGFQNPPAEARPFVRWWWPGSAADERGITAELDTLQAAGFGGVEINPLGLPKEGAQPRPWLSPEWTNAVRFAADEARRLGMIPDLIGGVGWPFASPRLAREHGANSFRMLRREISGPGEVRDTMAEFERDHLLDTVSPMRNRAHFRRAWASSPSPTEFHSMWLVSSPAEQAQPATDVSHCVAEDGSFAVPVPGGPHRLCALVFKRAYRACTAWESRDSFATRLCHFDAAAVQAYLGMLGDALNEGFGTADSWPLRSVFCDSYELGEEFWPMDFLEQFERRRGYDLAPYLHVVMDAPEQKAAVACADDAERLTHDYLTTFQELFRERFAEPFTAWCHAHGVKSRIQAYGRPWSGVSARLAADIPEGECWMWKQAPLPLHDWLFNPVANKITASAAHIGGRAVVSCETFTAPGLNGRIPLDRYKQGADMILLTGINNLILHGRGYSPADRPFPGWWAMGTFASHHNTWWPHVRTWTDYVARLSWVSQAATPQAQIAILGPEVPAIWRAADDSFWFPWHQSEDGTGYPVHLTDLWQSFSRAGYTSDIVSESVLQAGVHECGRLCCGEASYEAIIVIETNRLEPATAAALLAHANAGGTVIIAGRRPSRSHGYLQREHDDRTVRNALDNLIARHGRTCQADAEDVLAAVARSGVDPAVRLDQSAERLYTMHWRDGDRDILFFVNSDRTSSTSFRYDFEAALGCVPWVWHPEDGSRSIVERGTADGLLTAELAPLESLIIVYDPPEPGIRTRGLRHPRVIWDRQVSGPWRATFVPPVGPTFTRDALQLGDLAVSEDLELREFGGVVEYATTLWIGDERPLDKLNLGEVCNIAEITLNGEHAGCRWYGEQVFDISGLLHPGENELVVRVTTPLYNFLRGWRERDSQIPAGIKPDSELEPAGLIGPVRQGTSSGPKREAEKSTV